MRILKSIPSTKQVELAGIPITPASKHIPQWYKDIHPYLGNDTKLRFPMENMTHNSTIKRCVPFLDALTAGYTFVLDDDVLVEQTPQGPLMRWKSDVEIITWHSLDQFQGLPIPPNYHNMVAKWHNDYYFDTPPGYSLIFTHPVNRFDLPFLTITGIVDTDHYSMPVQFPFFLREGFEGILESGTPVAQLIPMKRDSWKHELGVFDADTTYKRFRKFKRTLANSYKKNFWQKKSYS